MINKDKVRLNIFNFLGEFDKSIRIKFDNINGKTGQYYVPTEIYQKRTSRSNRVLLPWRSIKKNNLTLEQLKSFTGGVVVEFLNNDYFDKENLNNKLFRELKNRLGSNQSISSIISIRSENGSSSSALQRAVFDKLTNRTEFIYNNEKVFVTKDNFKEFAVRRKNNLSSKENIGCGNNIWEGFLYISIRGGVQDVILSHNDIKAPNLFNPACEFATKDVMIDLGLTLSYFALKSISVNKVTIGQYSLLNTLINNLEEVLKSIIYDNDSYQGNLYDYCNNHPSLKLIPNQLTDPIQIKKIDIMDFAEKERDLNKSIDLTHDESVYDDKYYWDREKKCILTPARPTNLFWSYHLSNMMQQNFSLDEYFKEEERIYLHRKSIMKGI